MTQEELAAEEIVKLLQAEGIQRSTMDFISYRQIIVRHTRHDSKTAKMLAGELATWKEASTIEARVLREVQEELIAERNAALIALKKAEKVVYQAQRCRDDGRLQIGVELLYALKEYEK